MMRFFILLLGVISLCFGSFAQEVNARVNKKNIQVGEEFFIKYEIEVAKNISVNHTPEQVVLKAIRTDKTTNKSDTVEIEVTQKFQEERQKIQGKEYWIGTYSFISFDDGLIVIPPADFQVNGKSESSNPVMITVDLMPIDKKVNLHDIQENFVDLSVPFFEKYEQVIWWIVLLIVVGILIAIYFLFIKKWRPDKENEEEILSTNDRRKAAINQLNQLMEKELWAKDELKQHFTEMSLIVRQYISKEMGSSFLEKTSLETQLILRKQGFRDGLIKPLGLILNVSDLVKFAKSSVEKDGIFSVYQEAKSFIEEFEKK